MPRKSLFAFFLSAAALFAAAGPRAINAPEDLRDAPGPGSAAGALELSAGRESADYEIPVSRASSGRRRDPCPPAGPVSKQVTAFLSENGRDFDSYAPSCPSIGACRLDDGFYLHEKVYRVRGDAGEVFRAFTAQNPRAAWNGSSKFEMMYDRASRRVYTKNSRDIPAITTGQLFFLTLSLPLGLKIPVVFETVKLDAARREFAFSYVKANKSNGIQFISFTQEGSETAIRHTTHYRSGSEFRDKRLYARFHEDLTDDFYAGFFASLAGFADPCPL